ncbi:protein PLANT CADMIUM RESISTANCE 6 [Sesamum alatum]|uniref:Protein PLANT CADMIUM RESISTANCE 6 n=1 Tax=Sesamum alatum TaxID=300844 RepID=A0AAE1YAU6_9LAMI|nr:protein PLANT CADMIUM RESISTANCE 6 [Sesamum alatum]
MGRVDTNASQYHQGLQFQELHQTQAPETIDDAPHHDEEDQDLYAPPSEYQKPQQQVTNRENHDAYVKPLPVKEKPRDDELPHAFPPPQDEPHSFPPPHQDETPRPFPPTQTSDQHNVGGVQFPPLQAFGQPVGGVPMGRPTTTPSPFIHPQVPTQAWRTDLFDCMKNPQNAIITMFFPCVTFGQIAEILDSGSTSCGTSGMLYGLIACCLAMPCIMSCTYRSKMRSRFGLIESPAPDWLVHCFCEWCALCQEYRELQERGLDPSIGWVGNVAKQQQQQQQFAMTPPMGQRMM